MYTVNVDASHPIAPHLAKQTIPEIGDVVKSTSIPGVYGLVFACGATQFGKKQIPSLRVWIANREDVIFVEDAEVVHKNELWEDEMRKLLFDHGFVLSFDVYPT